MKIVHVDSNFTNLFPGENLTERQHWFTELLGDQAVGWIRTNACPVHWRIFAPWIELQPIYDNATVI